MKKIVLGLTLILFCSFGFVGCGNQKKEFWLDTASFAQTIFASNEFVSTYNITFNNNLYSIMTQQYGADYSELKNVLAPIFTSAISYAYFHYEDFLISPKNNNSKFKKEIKKVNERLEDFKISINNFKKKKIEYESYIDFTDMENATSSIELARLQLFKRDYISLIESAQGLSESIFNARRVGYYDFSDYASDGVELVDANSDCVLAVSASNLEITDTALEILKAYNTKESASEYSNYWSSAIDYYNFFEIITEKQKNAELFLADNVKNLLKKWQYVYNIFVEEKEIFLDAVEKLDLKLLTKCKNDAEEYSKQTDSVKNKIYADYYLNFYKNVEVLKTYLDALFN